MNELEQIEQKYNFKYPSIYKRLYIDGMLDWFKGWNEPWAKERNWYTEIYPTLLDNPPLILHTRDFEIFEFKDVIKRLDDIPDYWNTEHKFIPFGKSGAGDWYAFYLNPQDGENIPIVFVPHDEMNAQYLAKNMEDFIFWKMLEVTHCIDEEQWQDETTFRKKLLSMLKSHSSYLSAQKQEVLNRIYNRPIKKQEHTYPNGEHYYSYDILDNNELDDIFRKNADFEKWNVEFQYQLD
jgi:hypothetical protein